MITLFELFFFKSFFRNDQTTIPVITFEHIRTQLLYLSDYHLSVIHGFMIHPNNDKSLNTPIEDIEWGKGMFTHTYYTFPIDSQYMKTYIQKTSLP